MQTAVEEWQQVLSVAAAEPDKEFLLSGTEGRLLSPVEHQDLTRHLKEDKVRPLPHVDTYRHMNQSRSPSRLYPLTFFRPSTRDVVTSSTAPTGQQSRRSLKAARMLLRKQASGGKSSRDIGGCKVPG